MKGVNILVKENGLWHGRGSDGAAGYDLSTSIPFQIMPKEVVKVPTGICIECPDDFFAHVLPRSGLSSKGVIAVTGTIDSDYRGEISVLLHNCSDHIYTFSPGDRIAQLVFYKKHTPSVRFVNKLGKTDRWTGGFGSTGMSHEHTICVQPDCKLSCRCARHHSNCEVKKSFFPVSMGYCFEPEGECCRNFMAVKDGKDS